MNITVKELKKLLENVDENRIVILQSDAEGNGYSPLAGIDDELRRQKASEEFNKDFAISDATSKLQ